MNFPYHITFSPSAAGSLKEGFRRNSIAATVDYLPDDYTLGPICNPDDETRRVFLTHFLSDCPDRDDILAYSDDSPEFWKASCGASVPVVIWYSHDCAQEYTGLLEFLFRKNTHKNLMIVDVSGHPVSGQGANRIGPHSCAELSPEQLLSHQSSARPLTEGEFSSFKSEWERIARNNGVFRILREGELKDTPLSFYDGDLLSLIPTAWVCAPKVVGNGLGRFSEEYQNVGDTFLFLRLFELRRQGTIEIRGGPDWHSLEIRRISP